jgi:heat-inducible transcriptional repressor
MAIAHDNLKPRARHLLKVLVECYIRDGQPVGSRTLVRESGLDISSATVRNVMAELEEQGLVTSPHTSAGRIPTDHGYRVFVDNLLTVEPMDSSEVERIRRLLAEGFTLQGLAVSASGLLSGISSMAGVVMLPRREKLTLRHIEFVAISERRVLAILVVNEQEVHNTMIRTERGFSAPELCEAANYLNSVFAGKDLALIRRELLGELNRTRERLDQVMLTAVQMAEQVFDVNAGDDIVVSGQTHLMAFNELSDLDKLRVLFEAFSEKRRILHLLDQCLSNPGVQVFIGKESGFSVLDDCSLVTSTYQLDGRVMGVLGVIGPTRMAYKRVIPLVEMTARIMSAALKQQH